MVERRPGEAFAYVLEAGLALRDYKAVVTLTPTAAGGTTINWHSTFTAKVPGTGWAVPAPARGLHRAVRPGPGGRRRRAARAA